MYAARAGMFMIRQMATPTMVLILERLLKTFRMIGAAPSVALLKKTLKKNNASGGPGNGIVYPALLVLP